MWRGSASQPVAADSVSAGNERDPAVSVNPFFYPGLIPRTTSFGELMLNLLSFELDVWDVCATRRARPRPSFAPPWRTARR